jgi:hypothetical protein
VSPKRAPRVTYETVRRIALALPGVEEGTCYGTPACRVTGKLLMRLKEDGESLVVIVGFEARQELMKADPETFYVTDHYLNYPAVLVHLSKIDRDRMRGTLEGAWRRIAPKRLLTSPARRNSPSVRRAP